MIRRLALADAESLEEIIFQSGACFDKQAFSKFIKAQGNYAFGVFENNKVIGWAYCYLLLRPDGDRMLFLHSIDILKEFQNKGYGSQLIKHIADYARESGYSELFVITDKGNPSACRIYEKAGGKNDFEDEIVYVIDFLERGK